MKLTPLRSIRKFCLWCVLDQIVEIQQCPSKDCPLWRFRMGKGNAKLRDIRLKCLDCSGGSEKTARECRFPNCSLFAYRMGHRPKGTPKTVVGGAKLRRFGQNKATTTTEKEDNQC